MIPFRTRTVRVTTKGELDSALASNATRSIVVEGDDELLTYAARKASVEPDLSIGSVAFEAAAAPPGREPFDLVRGRASERTAVWDDPFAGDVGPEREGGAGTTPTGNHLLARVHRRRRWPRLPLRSRRRPKRQRRRRPGRVRTRVPKQRAEPPRGASSADPARLAPSAPATQPAGRPDSAPDAAPASPAPPAPASAEAAAASDLPSLVWPVVAIVAIVALYLVARQAISSGSNVEIHWQVTEKVTGRLVITKQSRPAKKAAA